MLYVQLDTNWPDNHKIIEVGIEGAGLHAIVLCLAKRLEADGWVRRALLYRQGAPDSLIDRLVDVGLLEAEGERVRPHDWHARNPSQAVIEARRASKIENGKKGNHDRWQHPWPFDSCPKCHPEPQVVAGCDPVGSQADSDTTRVGSQGYPTPTKSKQVVTTAIAAAIESDRTVVARHSDATIEQNRAGLAALKASQRPGVTLAAGNPATGATA